VKIGDMVRVMLGSYQGKIGKIECIFSRVKRFPMRGTTDPFDTLYKVQLRNGKEEICFPEKYLQPIN
jgi:ribosomal protein L24